MPQNLSLLPSGFAIVDDDDFERLSKFKWFVWQRRGGFEITRNLPGYAKGSIRLRHEILSAPPRHSIAFVNGDRLDHRKSNLLIVPFGGGMLLAKKRDGEHFGVYARKNGRFYASKRLPDGKLKHIGSYDSEEEAAAGYDLFVVRYFGRAGVLNFPENLETYVAMVRAEENA